MIFSPSKYSRLHKRLRFKFHKDITQIIKNLRKFKHSSTQEWLSHHSSEFKSYSPLKWFFLKQLQTLLFFYEATSQGLSEEFGDLENEVFEKWNQSEFAGDFLKKLNQGKKLQKAHEEMTLIFDQHLTVLAARSILKEDWQSKFYRPPSSLGEMRKKGKVTRLLETTLHFEGKDLVLMTSNLKEMKKFSQRIEVALKVIRRFSPTSWERFTSFSEVIIPISEPELVSYSHQELPGTSMINLYHRDFVDLMDDLLHENGHHHLNYYLNLGKLIEEPIDCIYYSPWRRTLRPLRGIYHAFFTFFWAFKLFADMASADELDSIFYLFSPAEKEKIMARAVEEYWMLDYTYQDLLWAKRKGLIHKTGWDIIADQRKELLRHRSRIALWEKKLKHHRKEIKELKKVLVKAKTEYSKS